MHTVRIAASCLAVLLLVGSQSMRADPAQDATPPATKRKGDHKVHVTVDEVVSVAVGTGAVANTRIGNTTIQATGDQEITVRVGNISHRVVGPNASVRMQIPADDEARTCD